MNQNSVEKIFKKIILRKGYPSFWFLNTVGWILLITADSFLVSPDYVLDNWHNFFSNTIQWAMGFVITIGLRFIYKRFHHKHKPLLPVLGLILFISLISSIILFYVAHLIFLVLNPAQMEEVINLIFNLRYIAQRLTAVFPLMTTWSLLYFGIKFWLDWSRERDRAEKLDLLAQSAQLQMLRYQVNPHFLFNSFSSLRALIRSNQSKAEEMVSKLSDFYRYSLTIKNNIEVPLIDEIEAVEHFFEIEKIRFGDKLEYIINIDSLAEEYPVPCFTIHPLVENAIKYGMKSSVLPLRVNIDAYVKNNHLIICVANSGRWLKNLAKNEIQGTNTGLDNIRGRLEYSYQNNHKIDIKEEDGFVKVMIEIYKEAK